MTPATLQAWIGVLGGLLTAILGITKYFNYKARRDQRAEVGAFFNTTVEGLSSDNQTRRLAAAVLLRRFFDKKAEQGRHGQPYRVEAIEVIVGLLRRDDLDEKLQKALADGLRYAKDLRGVDLQGCDLSGSFLGMRKHDKERDRVDLSESDLFEADCRKASFRGVKAHGTIFRSANLEGAVFEDANLEKADFGSARLKDARFHGARLEGAKFSDAIDSPLHLNLNPADHDSGDEA